jgi:hypothetical protein
VWGANTLNAQGRYETQGTPTGSNAPGARENAVRWVDSSNRVWVFGGYGYDGSGNLAYLNDLWRFDGSAWTWISGSAAGDRVGVYGTKGAGAAGNVPGGRSGATAWLGPTGNLWLFGGYGRGASAGAPGALNDLWQFDGSHWIWVAGSDAANQTGTYGTKGVAAPSNAPGGRSGAASWRDSGGTIWLFGGEGFGASASGALSDLWKFDSSGWTWVGGTGTSGQAGIYGSKGVPAASNVPGGRKLASAVADASGNGWLFGGSGLDGVGVSGYLNDLWRFDGASWTWVAGSQNAGQPGVYGTKGVADANNVPGGRAGAGAWRDAAGRFWLFGGLAANGAATGHRNDLWMFDGASWTWVQGSNGFDQPGTYGTKGVTDSANLPGGRGHGLWWTDALGQTWLFGGRGVAAAAGATGLLNDLWRLSE